MVSGALVLHHSLLRLVAQRQHPTLGHFYIPIPPYWVKLFPQVVVQIP